MRKMVAYRGKRDAYRGKRMAYGGMQTAGLGDIKKKYANCINYLIKSCIFALKYLFNRFI